jgi:hypothetical protein
VQLVRPGVGKTTSLSSTGWSSNSTSSSVASVWVSSPSVSGTTTHLVAGPDGSDVIVPFIPPA